MKVSLETRGGQPAGINAQLRPKVVDTASLPEAAASELARLVAAARSAPIPKTEQAERVRDAMSYTITIEDSGAPVVLSQSDTMMSDAFVALRNWVRKHSAAS